MNAVRASFGFRVKSGWATSVLLSGSPEAPRLVDRRAVDLADPAEPRLRQPHHAGTGQALANGPTLARRVEAIERFSERSLSLLVNHYRELGYVVAGAGLVVGSDGDPARISNQHIRAHALEGRLFRRMIADAMGLNGLACHVWVERQLYETAATRLGLSESQIRRAAIDLGRGTCGGWRSDEKSAAVAAWLVLPGPDAS